MAVVFDEVTAEVQPTTPERPATTPAPAAGEINPHDLRRELERQESRRARLRTD